MSLASLFSPRGIAIVGASDNARKFGGLTLENLIAGGFAGNIVPVNPARETVMGRQAYPSVAAIPGDVAIDIVTVCAPKHFVPGILEETAAKGIPFLMVMSGGYGEQGAEGAAEERALVARARALGVRIIGPNLLGMASTPNSLLLNASLAMREVPRRVGGVSLVSQSGASMGVLFNRGAREGVRFQHVIALGNQSDLEISEIIKFYAQDPGTRVVITSIEGLKNPQGFLEAVAACRAADKPVIAIKAGRTQEGARVAATHTGSMASDYTGFAARLETDGVILVQDELSMMRLAALYDKYGDAPKGGIALVSPSGGAIAQTTDRISEKGLKLAAFGSETHRRLETLYVPGLTNNPLDFANMHDNSFVDVGDGGAAILADDDDVAAIIGVFGTAHNLDEMVTGIGPAVDGKKPVLFTILPASNGDKARNVAAELGFMALDSIEETIEVLRLWFAGRPQAFGTSPRPAGLAHEALELGEEPAMLGEFEAKQLLGRYGIPVTREKKASTPEEAVAAAGEIGYPVVLKGFGARLIHKSEFGAVKLNLADADAVRAAWADMAGRIGSDLEGCVVGQMVKGQVEMICGSFRSEDFGPMVMFGAGGILAELLHDVAVLPAPAHPDAIRAKLLGLKCAKLLTGFRGKPPADIDALVDAIHRLSLFVADHDTTITELDINPLIVAEAGKGAVAVDARIGLSARKA